MASPLPTVHYPKLHSKITLDTKLRKKKKKTETTTKNNINFKQIIIGQKKNIISYRVVNIVYILLYICSYEYPLFFKS